MKKSLLLGLLFLVCGCNYEQLCSFNAEDATKMYSQYIEEWQKESKVAFDDAESKVFVVKPTPDVVGPDPDPKKCICNGTGIIVQGDDHKTPCPYHSGQIKHK